MNDVVRITVTTDEIWRIIHHFHIKQTQEVAGKQKDLIAREKQDICLDLLLPPDHEDLELLGTRRGSAQDGED